MYVYQHNVGKTEQVVYVKNKNAYEGVHEHISKCSFCAIDGI